MAAAAWSCVEKMLQEDQRTSAPRALSVSISTAVWMVMCRQPATRAPFSGWEGPYSRRMAMRPGISSSAMEISLRPQSARERSFTTWSAVAAAIFGILGLAVAGALPQGEGLWPEVAERHKNIFM